MKKLIPGMALLAAVAFGQYGGYRSTDPYGRDDNGRGIYDRGRNGSYGGRYTPSNNYANSQRFVENVQQQLNSMGRRISWDGWARRQFSDAVNDLERYQVNAARGRFDTDRLDGAIDNLNRLLTAPEIQRRDRQQIAYFRDQLRNFRANGGNAGRYNR